MAFCLPPLRLLPALAIALVVLAMPVHGQIGVPCTASMVSSFAPCINFVTNSSANGTSPTAGCCSALSSLMSNGTDCLCQIATGNMPFQVPVNRTLAMSLPRACNMPRVPLQCKATVAPIPAPGPIALGPISSPGASSPEALAPEADSTPDLTPSEAPTANSGSRPVLTPSAADKPSQSSSLSLLLAILGVIVLKSY